MLFRSLKESDEENLLSLDSSERNSYFKEKYFGMKMNQANNSIVDFHNYIIDNKIFLTRDIYVKFDEADKLLNSTLTTREVDQLVDEFSYEKYEEAKEELEKKCEEIEQLVQARLHQDRKSVV